jgi:hypothetical protein
MQHAIRSDNVTGGRRQAKTFYWGDFDAVDHSSSSPGPRARSPALWRQKHFLENRSCLQTNAGEGARGPSEELEGFKNHVTY